MRVIADRYRITSAIGRGGMGEVWTATDLRLNRTVAVKLVSRDFAADTEARRRFNREARITARLRHPGVPAVYDFGGSDELYLVMELVDGNSVDLLLGEHGALPVTWAACIAAQVCAVLTAAHQVQLVHRDLKPGNLVLAPTGLVKVIDFGAAASLRAGDYSTITELGDFPGSFYYMPPEVLEGAPATPAGDLYSIGCLLYELLTGSRPFASGNQLADLERKQEGALEPMEGVPAELEDLTRRLLSGQPDQRPLDSRTVHNLLMPWCRDFPALPGWVGDDFAADPVHLYVGAVPRRG
ncbi:serine/threonine protein kinase [Nocardia zapadnayensis]|uniref:serine/threonine-protein kinase n=1 Tax=Nocardia rhamnosiphila TaxID=426716 RepID=UPI002246975B|nr:serine/threonine-protein kinase [Nocardia zapadnayensis]MCX0274242.1 serine/threonine protein kinase [Nocardia zapadnayensis]